jgi:DinB superfamily
LHLEDPVFISIARREVLGFAVQMGIAPLATRRSYRISEKPGIMTNEEIFVRTALSSWTLVIARLDEALAALRDEDLQRPVAPGKNRIFYLVGHLTAVHDRLFSMLGLGERLHPELDEPFLLKPDRTYTEEISPVALRQAWLEVNSKLASAFEALPIEAWLQKHTAVSAEDFAKEPLRNRLAVLLSRTNHASFHAGQMRLAV